jgi:predicted transposase YbfD/YdcC
VEGKSDEIKAIPKLLEMLDWEGARVRVDASGCPKALAEQILEQRADT